MKHLLTYLLLGFSLLAAAEEKKDTVVLGEVLKVDKASANLPAYESPLNDLKYKEGERLGDALKEYSSVYIKNYGNGQLASIAVRGTSAEQTDIQWNGVKLNSPMLGQVDLSLFLIGMQDELQLVRTGYEGTIGGTLKMDNTVKLDSGFAVNATFRVASFNTYEGIADVKYAKNGFWGATKFSYLGSQNNFQYRDNFQPGNPYQTETNAAVQLYSFLQQFGGRINDKNELNFYIWLNGAQREIPPVISSPVGSESQDDYSARIMANWKGTFKNLRLKFTTAYLYDKLRYKNPTDALDETSSTQAIRNNFSASYFFPFKLALNGEVNYDHEQANTVDYLSAKQRNIVGLKVYGDYYLLDKFRFHTGFRQDLVDNKLSAFAPELSFNYLGKFTTANRYSLGFIASRNFRFPTLNDLYWNPGGNPNLKEEKSWNGEIQAKYSYKKFVELSASNFYVYVDDWIQWIPQASLWMPVNFRRVFSRGFEGTLHITNEEVANQKRLAVHFNTSYTYTKSTNLDASSEFDLSKGMQLIYVPYHNAMAAIQFKYYGFYIRSVNTYTGAVFISTDNEQTLKGYFISDLEVGKDFMIRNVGFGCSFRVNNISNTNYQVVAQRPMPGRNYEVTARFKFI